MTRHVPGSAATEVDDASFTGYGNSWFSLLYRPSMFMFDKVLVRHVGFSVLSWINARLGHRAYTPVMLLTSIGARSGELRSSVLPYIRVGDSLVVVASNAGGPADPAWVGNVRHEPKCWVRIRRRSSPATATIVNGVERDRLWDLLAKVKPNIDRYQERASAYGRQIPLVVLSVRRPREAVQVSDRGETPFR